MAEVTYHEHPTGTPNASSEIPYWDPAANASRRATRANMVGATITGAGTIATGGNTLTVAASGTAALRTRGTWTPVITGSVSNPTIAYTTQWGRYTIVDDVLHYAFRVVINTISGGSGTAYISLPTTVPSGVDTAMLGTARLTNVDTPAGTVDLCFATSPGGALGAFTTTHDDASIGTIMIANLGAGDVLMATGFYFAV